MPDLLDVGGVVPSHVAGQVGDGDAAAFGTDTMALPLLGREAIEHPQVSFAQEPEHVERIPGGPRIVVAELAHLSWSNPASAAPSLSGHEVWDERF